jgi:hypothetical protein
MRLVAHVALTVIGGLILAAPVQAQGVSAKDVPYIGRPVTIPDPSPPPAESDSLSFNESNVSILDSALPRSTLRMRFDTGYHDARPTRAEYFQAKGGLPLSQGMPLLEPNINSYQDLATYLEFAPVSFFSVFVESPVRWVNPQANQNIYGYGDTNFGFKLCTWDSQDIIVTLQLRVYDPTAQRPGLGTEHWTIEPAVLGIWRPFSNIMLEGDLRYWAPLNGSDFAGDIVRYGVGLSFGQASPQGPWIKPVVEAVGWTVLGGKTLVVTTPDAYFVEGAAGQTIVNGYVGVRCGLGATLDGYIGYGRCFTGDAWTRDFVRVELRLFY